MNHRGNLIKTIKMVNLYRLISKKSDTHQLEAVIECQRLKILYRQSSEEEMFSRSIRKNLKRMRR